MTYFIVTLDNGSSAEFADKRCVAAEVEDYLIEQGIDKDEAADAAYWVEDAVPYQDYEGVGYSIEIVTR